MRWQFLSMEPVWYGVRRHFGGWEVYANSEPLIAMRTSAEAHAFASQMALVMWQDHGYVPGVRTLGDDGTWQIKLTYGAGSVPELEGEADTDA